MKRVLALLLALSLLLCLFACGKAETAQSEEGEPASREITDPVELEEMILEEMNMLGKVDSWRGQGSDGHVKLPGSFATVYMRSASDLKPYQTYFPLLTNEDITRVTSDPDGVTVLLEIASPDTSLLYGVDEITREDGRIVFLVTSAPEILEPIYDDDGQEIEQSGGGGSPYEYFLFYIPADQYNDEEIVFNFAN